jgi:tripartite-type tricarboxylate transporter receptor subunit TctC
MNQTSRSRRSFLATMTAGAALASSGLHAQENWPARPIRIVVPVAAGGIIDLLARAVAKAFTSATGTSVVVESKPGADHIIGTQYVANSTPDGYTWLCASVPFTVTPFLRNNPGYDPVKDFQPLQLLATSPNVLVVPTSVSAKTVQEFVALAKKENGAMSYANPGIGSSNHLGMEMFKVKAGLNIVGVPYKGQPPAITDLLAGRVQAMMISASLVPAYLESGSLRALAVVARTRLPEMPNVPTIAEAGYPDVDVIPWFGLLTPRKTPAVAVAKASAELRKLQGTPGLIADYKKIGATPFPPNSPAEFEKLILSDLTKWPDLVRRAGVMKT